MLHSIILKFANGTWTYVDVFATEKEKVLIVRYKSQLFSYTPETNTDGIRVYTEAAIYDI